MSSAIEKEGSIRGRTSQEIASATYDPKKSGDGVDTVVTAAHGEKGGYEEGESHVLRGTQGMYACSHRNPSLLIIGFTCQAEGIHPGEGTVRRQLKQRHMAMIALGGAIGTGEFRLLLCCSPIVLFIAQVYSSDLGLLWPAVVLWACGLVISSWRLWCKSSRELLKSFCS